MVARYTLTADAEAIARHFQADMPEHFRPSFNAAPTHLLPLLTHDSQRGFSFFYWGSPPRWAGNKPLGEKVINVRAETMPEKAALRKKLTSHRCLVPADGYYDWKKLGKKTSVPYRFTLPGGSLFGMAGLWEEFEGENDDVHHTFSLLTIPSDANGFPERLPLVIPAEKTGAWLNESSEASLLELLKLPVPSFEHYSVSPLVNAPERNDRLLILPAPPADQYGNLTLFD